MSVFFKKIFVDCAYQFVYYLWTWFIFKSDKYRIWTSLLSCRWLCFRLEPIVWWNIQTSAWLQISFEYIFQLHKSIFLYFCRICFKQIYWCFKWIKVLIYSWIHILLVNSRNHSKLFCPTYLTYQFFLMIEFGFSYEIRPNRQS